MMASVNDWAAKAAKEIVDDVSDLVEWRNRRLVSPSEERIAAIIALHAAPLLELLQEAHNGRHSRGWHDEEQDYPPCPMSEPEEEHMGLAKCTCGADEWNAKVEAALSGETPKKSKSASR